VANPYGASVEDFGFATAQDGVCVTTGAGGCANGVDPSTTLGAACASDLGCGCPQNCVNDPVQGQSQCALPCAATSTDCSDPSTSCQNGFCVGNVCAGDAGPFYTICNAATDAGDGYCQPVINVNGTAQVGVCYQAGTADSGFACDPNAERFDAGALCVLGTVCFAPDGGTSYCEPGCDAVDANDCGAGNVCAANYNLPSLRAGVCYPAGAGGCALGLSAAGNSTELFSCSTSGFCGCPQTCLVDPGSGASFCEMPCASASDCDIATTTCLNGTCGLNYCDVNLLGVTAAGTYDGQCNVADAGDGTCQAQYPTDQNGNPVGPAYGLCQLDGNVTVASQGSCGIQSTDPTQLCQAGTECFSVDFFGDTGCLSLCDPTSFDGGSCGAGNGCFGVYSGYPGIAPTYGSCQLCTPPTSDAGVGCFSNSECCSLVCTQTANGGVCQ
jgi:hypothetical protein